MYTAIRREDGRFRFLLHVPPGQMSPDEARRALLALSELKEALEGAVGMCVRGPVRCPPSVPDD